MSPYLDPLAPQDATAVSQVLQSTFFIVAGQEQVWQDSFNLFARDKNYYGSLLLLLPLVEHGMRKMFLFMNYCPLKRFV